MGEEVFNSVETFVHIVTKFDKLKVNGIETPVDFIKPRI